MPLAGLILNRVHTSPAGRLCAARSLAAAETLENARARPDGTGTTGPRYQLAAAALRIHAERMTSASGNAAWPSTSLGPPGGSRR